MKIFRCLILFIVSLFLVAFCVWAQVLEAPDFPADKYGNKTANLDILQSGVCKPIIIGNNNYEVAVPEFIGISHDHVQEFLTGKLDNGKDGTIIQAWQDICRTQLWEKYGGRDQALAKLLKEQTYPEEFLVAVRALGEKIKKAFIATIFLFDIEKKQVSFIELAGKDGARLMVRSTGKEDTVAFANAGGNETIANVEPTWQAVSKAIGEVVASYFGEKSLKQRLAVATSSTIVRIFDDPFLPVLLQRMIGEPQDGIKINQEEDIKKIPVSGVLFTTEAEAKTSGVANAQCTYGHNEAVVNSLVPVDTYYLASVFPVIRKKWKRMVPMIKDGKSVLEKINNTWGGNSKNSFAMRPTLTYVEAQALKVLASRIEKYYGKPMDVEFVFMPEGKTFYLVQARPIIFGQKRPSYVNGNVFAQFEKENILHGCKVGVGNASARVARSIDSVLIYENLAQALDIYLGKVKEERNKIICVIVKDMPAATSHEATTFRAENMPVIQFDDLGLVRDWLAQGAEHNIIIDVQRGVLINTGSSFYDLITEAGWYESPMPRQLSIGVINQEVALNKYIVRAARVLGLRVNKSDQSKIIEARLRMPINDLLEALKTWDKGEDKVALIELGITGFIILYKLWSKLPGNNNGQLGEFIKFLNRLGQKEGVESGAEQLSKISGVLDSATKVGEQLMQNALICLDEIFRIAPQVNTSRDLRMLFPVHFLSALFNQERNDQIVGAYSLNDIAGEFQQDLRAMRKSKGSVKSLGELNLLKLSDASFSQETSEHWATFLQQLGQAKGGDKAKEALSIFIIALGRLDGLSLWFNTSFQSAFVRNAGNVGSIARDLLTEFDGAKNFFKTMIEHKRELEAFDITPFDDPEKFKKLWPEFQKLFEYFMSEEFLEVFGPVDNRVLVKSSLPQMIALTTMNKVVDLFDKAIKTMKGSTKYNNVDDKVEHFHEMVAADWNLFEAWLKLVPHGTFKAAEGEGETNAAGSALIVPKYLDNYRGFVNNDFIGEEQLQPSPEFSVTFSAIGSTAAGGRGIKLHLEDYFTLSHQNLLLTVSSLLNRVVDLDKIELPEIIKKLRRIFSEPIVFQPGPGEENIQNDARGPFKPSLLGVLFEDNMLSFNYNLPLRHHSAGFGLKYDKASKKAFLEARFFCVGNRPEQFSAISAYAGIVDLFLGAKLVVNKIIQSEVYVCWDVTEVKELEGFVPVIARMSSWMFSFNGFSFSDDQLSFVLQVIGDLDNDKKFEQALDVVSLSSRNVPISAQISELVSKVCQKFLANKFSDKSVDFGLLLLSFPYIISPDIMISLFQKVIFPRLKVSHEHYENKIFWNKIFYSSIQELKEAAVQLFSAWGEELVVGIKQDKPNLKQLNIFFEIGRNNSFIVTQIANKVVDALFERAYQSDYMSKFVFRNFIDRWWFGDNNLSARARAFWSENLNKYAQEGASLDSIDGNMLRLIQLHMLDDNRQDVAVKSFDVIVKKFNEQPSLEVLSFVNNAFNFIDFLTDSHKANAWMTVLDSVLKMLDNSGIVNAQDISPLFNIIDTGLHLVAGQEEIKTKACLVAKKLFERIGSIVVPSKLAFSWFKSNNYKVGSLITALFPLCKDSWQLGMRVYNSFFERIIGDLQKIHQYSEQLVNDIAVVLEQLSNFCSQAELSSIEVFQTYFAEIAEVFFALLRDGAIKLQNINESSLIFITSRLNNSFIFLSSRAIKDEVTRDNLKEKWVEAVIAIEQKFASYLKNEKNINLQMVDNLKLQFNQFQEKLNIMAVHIHGRDKALAEFKVVFDLNNQSFFKNLEQGNLSEQFLNSIDEKIANFDVSKSPNESIILRERVIKGLLKAAGKITDMNVRQLFDKVRMMSENLIMNFTEETRDQAVASFSAVMELLIPAWMAYCDKQDTIIEPMTLNVVSMPLMQASNKCNEFKQLRDIVARYVKAILEFSQKLNNKGRFSLSCFGLVNQLVSIVKDTGDGAGLLEVQQLVFTMLHDRVVKLSSEALLFDVKNVFDAERMFVDQCKKSINQFMTEEQTSTREKLCQQFLKFVSVLHEDYVALVESHKLYQEQWLLNTLVNMQDGLDPKTNSDVRDMNKRLVKRLVGLIEAKKISSDDIYMVENLINNCAWHVFDFTDIKAIEQGELPAFMLGSINEVQINGLEVKIKNPNERIALRERIIKELLKVVNKRTDRGGWQIFEKAITMSENLITNLTEETRDQAVASFSAVMKLLIPAWMAYCDKQDTIEPIMLNVVTRLMPVSTKCNENVQLRNIVMLHAKSIFEFFQKLINEKRFPVNEFWRFNDLIQIAKNIGDVDWLLKVQKFVFNALHDRVVKLSPDAPSHDVRMAFDAERTFVAQFGWRINEFNAEEQKSVREKLCQQLLNFVPVLHEDYVTLVSRYKLYQDQWLFDNVLNMSDGLDDLTGAAVREMNKKLLRRLQELIVDKQGIFDDISLVKNLINNNVARVFDFAEAQEIQGRLATVQ